MKNLQEDPKEAIFKYVRHYQVLIISMTSGIVVTILAFGFETSLIPKGWAVTIDLILIFGNIVYDFKRNSGCSKCGNWINIQQTNKIEKGGMLMPNGIDSMRKYRCKNCDHTWTEFYSAPKRNHF